jgi:hypothetical protein
MTTEGLGEECILQPTESGQRGQQAWELTQPSCFTFINSSGPVLTLIQMDQLGNKCLLALFCVSHPHCLPHCLQEPLFLSSHPYCSCHHPSPCWCHAVTVVVLWWFIYNVHSLPSLSLFLCGARSSLGGCCCHQISPEKFSEEQQNKI